MDEFEFSNEGEEFGQKTECLFCHGEDLITKLEAPCACKGTIKFAHRKCVQKWCNAKENIKCEICHEPYKPDNSAPTPRILRPQFDLSDTFHGAGGPRLYMYPSPPLLQTEETESLVDECDINENATRGGRWCSLVLIVQSVFCFCNALFLTIGILQDIFFNARPRQEDDTSIMYYVTFGLLIPSYFTSFVVSYWQSRKNRPEILDSIATAEIAIVIDSGEHDNAVDQRLHQVLEAEVVSESEDPPFVS